ncbi:hypothetical protein BD560DRAFT_429824 [Blakeslea trispora]|nr:hypothetical protein BD560DRAFT_429824 [Blakeslea trispora]
MNDKMELRGEVISRSWQFNSKKDAIIVNIISGERINSSYISRAPWMIKGSFKGIIFFERHSISPSSPIPNLEYLKLFVYTVDLPNLKINFQYLKLTVLRRDNKTFHPCLVRVISWG